jgi:anti-sigma B factor antagonist
MTQATATFTVLTAARSGECVVKAEGEIDVATAPQLRDLLLAELDAAPERLIVDMADVSFIDSSGLSALIDAFKQGQSTAIQMFLRAPSRGVNLVLGVSGLDKVFPVVGADSPKRATGMTVLWPLVDSSGTVTCR